MKTTTAKINKISSWFWFEEGLLAEVEVRYAQKLLRLIFNAVPLLPGHPKFDANRLKNNPSQGMLYSNEDGRNIEVNFTGCAFKTASIVKMGRIEDGCLNLELNYGIDKFELVSLPNGDGTFELKAEDICIEGTFKDLEFSE